MANGHVTNHSAKHWCFTINNPIRGYDELNGVTDWNYMVAGNEVADSGTPHLQGYVCFNKRMYQTQVSRMLPTAHLEIARGTPLEAAEYCMKDADYFEAGVLPLGQSAGSSRGGKATQKKYRDTYRLAKSRDLDAIEEQAPDLLLKHYTTIKRIGMDNPPRVHDISTLQHEWIWGAPGIGKSRVARLENPGHYLKSHNKWWNGYHHEDVVLIDDLDRDDAKWIGQFLKTWCDHYPFQAEEKFGNMVIRPKKIVITSNYQIEELFPEETLAKAIRRRLKVRNIVESPTFDRTEERELVDLSDLLDGDAPVTYRQEEESQDLDEL